MRKRAAALVLSLLILCVAPMQAFALGTNNISNKVRMVDGTYSTGWFGGLV